MGMGAISIACRQLERAELQAEKVKGGGYRIAVTLREADGDAPDLPACPMFGDEAPAAAAVATRAPMARKAVPKPVPMTVVVSALDPNGKVIEILVECVPNGPAVNVPNPPSMTILGEAYVHLL